MDTFCWGSGIIGGIGLGLLLISEFSGRIVTLSGSILVVITLLFMGIVSYKKNKYVIMLYMWVG